MPKPYTVQWPMKARSAEDIDKMFRDLYNRLEALEAAASGSLQPNQTLTRTVVGQ